MQLQTYRNVSSLLDYFLKVHAVRGTGFKDTDIDAKLRAFCEILQDTINHPFSDGGPEPDYDLRKWKDWQSEHGAHVAFHSFPAEGRVYRFSVVTENLTNHGSVMDWYTHAQDYEVGLQFIFCGALVDLDNADSMARYFTTMKAILLQTKGIKPVLEHLKNQDVWTYLIPNIVI